MNPPKADQKTFRSVHEAFYDELAVTMNNSMITVDMFYSLHTAFDTATLSDFSRRTGGQVRILSKNYDCVCSEILNDALLSNYREAVFRVRTTHNLSTKARYGNFHCRNTDLLAVPCMNPNAAFVVEYTIIPSDDVDFTFIQTVFLYTTQSKERILRIGTYALPHKNVPLLNTHALAISCSNISAVIALREGKDAAKKYLTDTIKSIPQTAPGYQEALYYLFCLSKASFFEEEGYMCAGLIRTRIGCSDFPVPVVYTIDADGSCQPATLSHNAVKGKITVLCIGTETIIGVDQSIERRILKACFNVSTMTEIAPNSRINEEDNPIANAVRSILTQLSSSHVVVDCSDEWKKYLVEDSPTGMDYTAFVHSLHN